MKKALCILSIVLAGFCFVGCAKKAETASSTTKAAKTAEKKVTLKLQHPGVEGDAYFLGAEKFADLANQYSNGSLTIEVYPNGQLASGANAVQGVQMGTIDIAVESSMTEANFIPALNVLNLPFLFSNYEQVWKVLDGPVGKKLADEAEKAGFKMLCYWDNGFRNLSNNVRPIDTVADVKGLKIRVPENKVYVATWEALGAIPTPMAWSEVYSALQLGTVDGQENPNGHMQSYNLTEVQKYFAITNHVYTAEPIIMNLAKFNGLSENQQQALCKAAQESAIFERQKRSEINDQTLQWIQDQGTQISQPDLAGFKAAMDGVYQKFGSQHAELLKEIQEVTK